MLLKALLTVLILAVTSFLFPQLPLGILRSVLCSVGWLVQNRTRSRREQIVSQVRAEEEEFRSKCARSPPQTETVEGDWEKVDSSSSSCLTPGSDKIPVTANDDWDGIIGFFHPFCNAGGGGERVLWEAVRAVQQRWPKAICAIYTGDYDMNKTAMLERVENRFNIQLHVPTVVLLYLTTRKYVISSMYPYMTLLGQSLGSLVVAYDAFNLLVPDIFIDTMGYAFALAFCKLLFPSVPTGAYVHYPTISTDMLESLDDESGVKGINAGAGRGLKGHLKRKYWLIFARLYGWVGGQVDVVMCNSSWTAAHIKTLWGPHRNHQLYKDPSVVFPPTAVSDLTRQIKVDHASETNRRPTILYIAQFRPEKNHPLVLRSFARFLAQRKNSPAPIQHQQEPHLILIGSVRHSSPDETHIYNLRLLAHELRIRDQTTFLCDASWPTILSHLETASIGANAMWNEHFGICVVEYQAAGLISVVHDSGGPREDIVVDLGEGETGFRASTEEDFAAAFETVLGRMRPDERVAMRVRARSSAGRFEESVFRERWVGRVEVLVGLVG